MVHAKDTPGASAAGGKPPKATSSTSSSSKSSEMAFQYRRATMADHTLTVELLTELVEELGPGEQADRVKAMLNGDLKSALKAETVQIIIAELDGHPVGLSRGDILDTDPIFRLRDDHRCGYVDQMYVRKPYRDTGVGGVLLKKCEEWFRSNGVQHSILHSAPRAVRFYARLGYQPNREMFKRL